MSQRDRHVDGMWKAYQTMGYVALLVCAVTLTGLTTLSAINVLPWLTIDARFGDMPLPYLGMGVQIGVTVLVVLFMAFLPSHRRVMALEASQRDFKMSMDDVAEAYALAHAADREGAFTLSREFDAMRERIEFMRAHPTLQTLEPEVIEVAAQMSHEARDLADVYSIENVARARTFLRQRQEEIEIYREQITLAQSTTDELKRWMQALRVEENVADQSLDQLERDLKEIALGLGLTLSGTRARKVVTLTKPVAAQPEERPTPKPQRANGGIVGTSIAPDRKSKSH